jgi:branched-chain amino acid transport system substrate-binding protein
MGEFGLSPDIQVVASGYFTAGVLGAMGGTAEGLVQAAQYTTVLDTPENKAFLELYEAQVGGEPSVYVEEGYLGAEVAARALESLGGDLSDIQAFLDALAGLDFDGPSGPIRFDENGQSVRNVYITRVVVGEDGTVQHEVIDVIEDVTLDWTPE